MRSLRGYSHGEKVSEVSQRGVLLSSQNFSEMGSLRLILEELPPVGPSHKKDAREAK